MEKFPKLCVAALLWYCRIIFAVMFIKGAHFHKTRYLRNLLSNIVQCQGILNLLRTLKVLGAIYVVDFPTQCFLSLLFGFLSNIVGRNNLAVLLCSEERQCHRCWNPAVVKFTRPLTFYTRTPLPTSPTPLYLLKTYFFSPFNLSLASFPRHGSTAMNTTNFCAFSPDQGSFDLALTICCI